MKKQTILILLILGSMASMAQAKKPDSVHLNLSLPELQLIYQAVDNAHADHMEIKQLLEYIGRQYAEQAKPKVDSTGAKK